MYGTFRAGETARAMIAGHVDQTRAATARGSIYAFPEGYPGMVASDDATVIGEVLDLNDLAAALALLDAYEGDGYDRTLRKVTLYDGTDLYAWCYMLADPSSIEHAVHIPDGDWVKWRRANA